MQPTFRTCHRRTCWFLLKFSSTLKMEAICSSETSVASQQTTRRHMPEDDTLYNHRCESLKSYKNTFGYTILPIPPQSPSMPITFFNPRHILKYVSFDCYWLTRAGTFMLMWLNIQNSEAVRQKLCIIMHQIFDVKNILLMHWEYF
jgi:hypothetical protein